MYIYVLLLFLFRVQHLGKELVKPQTLLKRTNRRDTRPPDNTHQFCLCSRFLVYNSEKETTCQQITPSRPCICVCVWRLGWFVECYLHPIFCWEEFLFLGDKGFVCLQGSWRKARTTSCLAVIPDMWKAVSKIKYRTRVASLSGTTSLL